MRSQFDLQRIIAILLVCGSAHACSLSELTETDTPSNVVVAGDAGTEAGAVALYRGALALFAGAYAGTSASYTITNGMLADEFTTTGGKLDLRIADATFESAVGTFKRLSETRLNIDRAIFALKRYTRTAPVSFRGELHAIKGYIYVMIAELYCSGVPFSTVDPDGRVTLGAALTTTQMFEQAITQFDSAIAIATDSSRIRYLAMVGKGRALLNLADYTNAAQAVASVPNDFISNVTFGQGSSQLQSFWQIEATAFFPTQTISDREGINGMPFVSSADPRLPLTQQGMIGFSFAYLPTKYLGSPSPPISLASGTEARLIKAESELKAGNATWLATVNALRTTCTSDAGCPVPAPAGTGGVGGLPWLPDQASDAERVNVLFRERAFWLFGTGHRTGDLRRMIRQYQRLQSDVFPIGQNPNAFTPPNTYGSHVNLELPETERANPNYNGCLNRDA